MDITLITAAGSNSAGVVSGNSFQNQFALYPDGHVEFVPQIWRIPEEDPWYIDHVPVGTNTYKRFYGKMIVYKPQTQYVVLFTSYAYQTQTDIDNDTPIVINRSHSVSNQTHDRYFLVGRRTDSPGGTPHLYKFTQAGVETSNGYQPSNYWRIKNDHFAWLQSGYWHYDPRKSLRWDSSFLTYKGTISAFVGTEGNLYARKYASASDTVTWEDYTSAYPDGTSLWTGSGTPAQPPYVPFY